MSGPSSRASFLPSDTRMGGSLRIIVLFWMVYSGSQEPVRLGATCPRSSASGHRSTASSAAGPWPDCGRISWTRLELCGDRARQAADGRQHRDPRPSSCGGRSLRQRNVQWTFRPENGGSERGCWPVERWVLDQDPAPRQQCWPPDEDRDHAWAGFRLHRL